MKPSRCAGRALLIDLDNCPHEAARLPERLDDFSPIVVCHQGAEPRVPLGLVTRLAPAVQQGRLQIVGLRSGKNASDFGLAFHAGKLAAQLPPDTEFTILSGDTGLDHVLDLLRRSGHQAVRLPSHDVAAAPRASTNDAPDAGELARLYRSRHLVGASNRPTTKKGLRNGIKRFLAGRPGVTVDDVLYVLAEDGIAFCEGQRVSYPALDEDAPDEAPAGADDLAEDIPF